MKWIAAIVIFSLATAAVITSFHNQGQKNFEDNMGTQKSFPTHQATYLGQTINYTSGCNQEDDNEYRIEGIDNISSECVDEDTFKKVKKLTKQYGDNHFICEIQHYENFDTDRHEIEVDKVDLREHKYDVEAAFEKKLETRLLESIYVKRQFYKVGRSWQKKYDDGEVEEKYRQIIYSYNVDGKKAAFVKAHACSFFPEYGGLEVRYVLDPYQQVKKHIYQNKTIQEFEAEMKDRGFTSKEIYRVEQKILP